MRRRAAAALAALALTGGVAAGCGDDDSNGSGDDGARDATRSPPGAPAGIEDFRACLEDQGVELPGGLSDEVRKAFEECRNELPEDLGPRRGGGPPDFGQGRSAPDPQPQ